MQYWTLWKHGPDREPNGVLAAHLVACTDSFDALTRRGAQLTAQHSSADSPGDEWIEWPRGSRRYQLGTERDGTYMVIEPDVVPETVWAPLEAIHVPAVDQWLDEDVHSLR
jgi:hypothetical protein